MIHEIFPVGPLQCNCSVIGDEKTREAMVVDPGDDIERVLAIVQRHGLTVKQIVITHGHIDHIGGAMKLKAATGAPILMNEGDLEQIPMLEIQAAWIGVAPPPATKVDSLLKDAAKLRVGGLEATAIHTPGHTEGSSCLYFPAEKKLIAGDTLFAGSIGRTDLPGGSFEKIIDSLRSRLLALPDDTLVIPGHGPATTIGEERATNPFLIRK
jgi:hydroxyacylglutathione hydrolase